jgi:succinate dehydrogenase / fumarate reductase, membrane anchor subunit
MVSGVSKQSVGAHYGLRDWLSQRVTAIVITAYTALLLFVVLWHGGVDYAFWQGLFARGWFRIASFLFMAALFVHAWVGVRNILMDYAKPVWVRLTLQILVICALVVYAGWTVQVLWGEPGVRASQSPQGRPS